MKVKDVDVEWIKFPSDDTTPAPQCTCGEGCQCTCCKADGSPENHPVCEECYPT